MIVLLLPTYNEELSIPALLPKIAKVFRQQNTPFKIIAANDGSTDSTAQLLDEYVKTLPLQVVTHKINRGLGETSRDLFEAAAELCSPEDIIIRMDCDHTHDPEHIPAMIAKLREGYDVVIASRFQPGGGQKGVGLYRGFISCCANLFMKVVFPIRGVRDYSCGFRAYRASVVQEAIRIYGNDFIQLKGLGFTGTLEKLIKLKLLGARFTEIPFVLRYDQKLSASKMVSSITTLGYFVMAILYYWPWGGWRAARAKPKTR